MERETKFTFKIHKVLYKHQMKDPVKVKEFFDYCKDKEEEHRQAVLQNKQQQKQEALKKRIRSHEEHEVAATSETNDNEK